MAYEKTEVMVAKSQEQIRKLIYSHRGSALSLVSNPPQEGLQARIRIAETDYHVRVMAACSKLISKGRK